VIGLFGDWGSGKSSIKNMTVEVLTEGEDSKLTIVEFSPWQFSGPDAISEAFFLEIGAALGKEPGQDETVAKRRAARWKLYSSALSVISTVARAFKSATNMGHPTTLGIVSSAALIGLDTATEAVKAGADAVASEVEVGTLSLAELKASVADDLINLKSPILVVLDDIDRLTKDEIRLVFQLVKANADFPNIIYLLLAQREILTAALNEIAPDKGEAFLEKIVQLTFDVPRINRKQLQSVLFTGLDCILKGKSLEKRFDKNYWSIIFPEILPLFLNLREVNRFLSSLAFHVELFLNGETFEVNPIDLIGLEILRLFEPKVYQGLPKEKEVLTYEPRWFREKKREEDKKRIDGLIALASAERGKAVRELIRHMFPPIELSRLVGDSMDIAENRWFQQLRACSHQAFDRYFQLATPDDDIAQADIDELVANMSDQHALDRIFASLKEKNLLETMLSRLHSLKETLPLDYASPFLAALFEIEPTKRDYGFLEISPRRLVIGLTYWYLQRQSEGDRVDTLTFALARTRSVGVGFMTAAHLALDPSPDSSVAPFLKSPELRQKLRLACVKAIHRTTKENKCLSPRDDLRFVQYWKTFDPAGAAKWLKSYLQSGSAILAFLRALVSTSDGTGGARRYILYGAMENLIEPKELEKRIKKHLSSTLTAEESELLTLFRAAIKRRREGQSEDPIAMMRDNWQ